MRIARDRIVTALRDRGQQARADWVERELPERVDPAKHSGLLATLNLNPADLVDAPPLEGCAARTGRLAYAPTPLRPVGAGDRPARRRAGQPRGRRDALRDTGLRHVRPARRGLPTGVRGRPGPGRSGVGGDARLPRDGPLGAVRRGAQSPGLAAAGVRGTLPRAAADHSARLLRRGDPARLWPSPLVVRVDLHADRAPELDYVATVYHGVDVAHCRSPTRPVLGWPPSAGSTRTRAPTPRSRSPAAPAGP